MAMNLLDRLGDWNPQFFRELKGRLNPRNVLMAIALSIVGQGLLLFIHYGNIPRPLFNTYSTYCTGNEHYGDFECIENALGGYIINWQAWWMDLYVYLSVIIVFLLGIAGTYLLIQNLTNEERNGTLNFIRLSPRSTLEIFLGKLLGVPIVLYWIVALAIPLHWFTGLQAHLSPLHIAGYHILVMTSCIVYFCAAMAFSLLSNNASSSFLPMLGAGFMFVYLLISANTGLTLASRPTIWLLLFSPLTWLMGVTNMVNANMDTLRLLSSMDGIQWFGLPIGTTAASLCLAMLVNAAIWVFWFGQVLERRFRNPSTTILSKRQSYCITLCFELTLLGFLIPVTVEGSSYADWWDFTYAAELLLLNVVYCALLVMALLPNRQLMQDWARYRHRNLYHSTGRQWRSSTWFDLLWHEKSPALIAIGVNMAIAAGLLMIWLLSAVSRYQRYFTFSLLLTLGSLLLCAAIAQYTMSLRTPKRNMWTAVGVAIAILTPIITAIMVSSNLESVNTPIWLFTIIPWIAIEHMSGMIAIGVFLTQLSLFGLIHSALSYRLHKFGESEMKVLLSATHS